MSTLERENEKENKVIVYYHVAKYPSQWGGTEYWIAVRGEDEDLVDIVKSVALRFGKWDIIMGNAYEDGRFVITLKEKYFQKFQNLFCTVKFVEVDSDRIRDLAE